MSHADEEFVTEFWRKLRQAEPKLFRGFQPIEFVDKAGVRREGMRILDIDGDWGGANSRAKRARIEKALKAAAADYDADDFYSDFNTFEVSFPSNDWRGMRDGEGYIQRLLGRGRSALAGRLQDPALHTERDGWVEEAFTRNGYYRQGGPPNPTGAAGSELGQIGVANAAHLGLGAAGAAYGYATDNTNQRSEIVDSVIRRDGVHARWPTAQYPLTMERLRRPPSSGPGSSTFS